MTSMDGLTRIADPLLSDVNERHINEMNIDPLRGTIRFRLVIGAPGTDEISLTLEKVAYASIACNPDDIQDLGVFAFVAGLGLYFFTDGGSAILSKLNYPILDLDGNVRSYPATLRLYLHIEGDICADIICGSYRVSH